MDLDLVHDIQKVYRKTLNCIARPGIIDNIEEVSERVGMNIKFYNSTMIFMLMLLDGEVTFNIISNKESEITSFVNQMTYSKAEETKKADFIFILQDASEKQIEEAFALAKIGSLIDPHKAATIIFEVDALLKEEELLLKGPGIKDYNYVKIQTKSDWLKERSKKNVEYPLGIDIIFIDKVSNIMCLPRTTQVLERVV